MILRLQKSLKVECQLNLGKPLETFVVLSYFNYFCFCSLETAEILQIFDLQWELKQFRLQLLAK